MRTEAEEARWFEENQDRLLELFEQAGKDGALRIAPGERPSHSRAWTLRLTKT